MMQRLFNLIFWKPEYRIVRDIHCGYEVQWRTWYWPFWRMPGCNTWPSLERAEDFARDHARGTLKFLGNMEKNDGRF